MNPFEKIKSGQILPPSEYQKLFIDHIDEIDDNFINMFADVLDWTIVFRFYKFSDEMLRKHMHRASNNVQKMSVSIYQKLNEQFMEDYRDDLIWMFLSIYQEMSPEFIKSNTRFIDFAYLPYYQDISLRLLKDLVKTDKVTWNNLSSSFPLTEEFILEYYEYLNRDLLKENKAIELTDSVELLFKLKE